MRVIHWVGVSVLLGALLVAATQARVANRPSDTSEPRVRRIAEPVTPEQVRKRWRRAYRGSERLVGRLHGFRSQATVLCLPAGFHPDSDDQYGELSTESDAEGRFEFRHLPEAAHYQVYAFAPGQLAQRSLSTEDRAKGPLSLTCHDLEYEKVTLRSTAGPYVSIAGFDFGVQQNAESFWSPNELRSNAVHRYILRRMNFNPAAGPGELIRVVKARSPRPTVRPAAVSIPGYDPQTYTPSRFRLEQWPKSDELLLVPAKARAMRVRLRYPKISWPRAWRVREITLQPSVLFVPNTGQATWMNPQFHSIFVGAESEFSFMNRERVRIDGARVRDEKGWSIHPDLGPLAFVEIHFNPGRYAGEPQVVAANEHAPDERVRGLVMWPGCVRFGAIRPGRYALHELEQPMFPPKPRRALRKLGVVEVVEGHQVVSFDARH